MSPLRTSSLHMHHSMDQVSIPFSLAVRVSLRGSQDALVLSQDGLMDF